MVSMDLLENVKGYLKITWDDEDDEIKELIEEGKNKLEELVGVPLIFEDVKENLETNTPSQKRDLEAVALLKDYCRYTRNYSKEYFLENFQKDIIGLQLKYADSEASNV